MIRETVVEGEPALAVDTEEECDRALDSGVYVVPPSWANAMAWHPWDEKNTDFLEDFRYTSIIGEGLRARSPTGQGSEVVLGCEILNQMTAPLGRPVSYRIGR